MFRTIKYDDELIVNINVRSFIMGNDNRLNNLDQKSVDKFNIAEARGWIIDRMNQIERIIDKEIINFIGPEKEKEFKRVILNSSIISFGAKIKIVKSLELVDTSISGPIDEMKNIRNGFAHSNIVALLTATYDQSTPSSDVDVSAYHSIHVMNSSGQIKEKKVHEQLISFKNKYDKVCEALNVDPVYDTLPLKLE